MFSQRQVKEAMEHASEGGQALHMFKWGIRTHGHLLDQNRGRLVETARKFGVRSVFIHRADRDGQHVDLWGEPLLQAVREAIGSGGI